MAPPLPVIPLAQDTARANFLPERDDFEAQVFARRKETFNFLPCSLPPLLESVLSVHVEYSREELSPHISY